MVHCVVEIMSPFVYFQSMWCCLSLSWVMASYGCLCLCCSKHGFSAYGFWMHHMWEVLINCCWLFAAKEKKLCRDISEDYEFVRGRLESLEFYVHDNLFAYTIS